MTIQALNPLRTAPARPASTAAVESRDRYLPAEEGTLALVQAQPGQRMAVGQILSQAGLQDVQSMVSWMANAAPEGLSLSEFARKALSGVRAVTPNVKEGVHELIRLSETCRRAQLQPSPESCLDQGLHALALVYGPLDNDPARVGEFRGLLGVIGDPQTTYQLLHDPCMSSLEACDRSALLNQVVADLVERHEGGQSVGREDVLQLRDAALAAFAS